jgi:aspartyl-tRNA(Asn)/glutamyl-tRNA(Gln) amidotransferase subunit A
MISQEPWACSAAALGALYASGRLTPVAALESILDRVAAINPRINAIVTLDSSGARAAALASTERWREGRALGPLDGVPITIKDNLEVAGLRCTWGSPLFAHHVPREDELPIARLRAAGAIIVGKTNCSEFAMVGHTDNAVFGVTRNPWDTSRTAGGSSGGAVTAVAAGLAPLALGTDGGGSTRRPAAHTGLVGFKPTVGRIARAGGLPPLFLHYEVCGPIARTVADVVLLTRALASPSPSDPASQAFRFKPFDPSDSPGRLRILHIPTFGHAPVDPEISALIDGAASRFAALGHHVERAGHWEVADAVNDRWMTLSQCGLARMLDSREPRGLPEALSPIARANAAAGRAASGAALFDLLESVSLMQQRLGDCLSQFDVLLTPATAALPWPVAHTHPESIAGQPVGPRGHAVFTGFVNAAGLPAIALPCGVSVDGLPNGLQLVGRWGDDELLLALAAQWEHEERGFERWPPI